MIDRRLGSVRKLLLAIDPADKTALAAAWRTQYRELLTYTLHGMHEIAFNEGIAEATAGDWLEPFDLTEPDARSGPPAIEVRATRYSAGHALNVRAFQQESAWAYRAQVEDERGGILAASEGEGFADLDAAFRAGMAANLAALGGAAG